MASAGSFRTILPPLIFLPKRVFFCVLSLHLAQNLLEPAYFWALLAGALQPCNAFDSVVMYSKCFPESKIRPADGENLAQKNVQKTFQKVLTGGCPSANMPAHTVNTKLHI
jgi:hypothetical protein